MWRPPPRESITVRRRFRVARNAAHRNLIRIRVHMKHIRAYTHEESRRQPDSVRDDATLESTKVLRPLGPPTLTLAHTHTSTRALSGRNGVSFRVRIINTAINSIVLAARTVPSPHHYHNTHTHVSAHVTRIIDKRVCACVCVAGVRAMVFYYTLTTHVDSAPFRRARSRCGGHRRPIHVR